MARLRDALPPGLRGYEATGAVIREEQAHKMGQLAQLLRIIEAQQTMPARRRLLESQASENEQQVSDMKLRSDAGGKLSELLATGGYKPQPGAAPLTGVAMSDQEALQQVIAAEKAGQSANVAVPNPMNVRSLATRAYPPSVTELLRQERPSKPEEDDEIVRSVPEGYITKKRGQPAVFTRTKTPGSGQEKPPKDFEWVDNGSGGKALRVIKGSKTHMDVLAKINKAEDAKKAAIRALDTEADLVEKLAGDPKTGKKEHKGLQMAVGQWDVLWPQFAVGADVADFRNKYGTLLSRAAVGTLQQIRQANAGSVGQITEREWPRLERFAAAIGIDRGEAAFRQDMHAYLAELRRVRGEVAAADPKLGWPGLPEGSSLPELGQQEAPRPAGQSLQDAARAERLRREALRQGR